MNLKSTSLIVTSILLFSSLLLANQRGLYQRLSGDGLLPVSDAISLDREIETITGEKVSSIILSTPYRTNYQSKLKLDKKRSIVLIDKNSINELEPELKNAIEKVISNKDQSLLQKGIRFPKAGIENFYVFGNFRSSRTLSASPEWFIGIIPKSVQVETIRFQLEWFGGGAGAHTQVRMILNTPVIGIPQFDQSYSSFVFDNGQNQGDITYSLQAARVEGGEQDWEPLKGVMGEFGNALQIFNTRTLAVDQITRSYIKEYKIPNLSNSQKNEIFKAAISDSDNEQETGIYNTVFASCVTYALRALKAGIPSIDTTWFNPYSIVERIGTAHGKGLELVGSVNDEFGPMIDNQDVISMQSIRATKAHRMTNLIRRDILEKPAFDDLIQKITIFIIDEGITYDQLKSFMATVNNSDRKISDIANTVEGKKLVAKISELWSQAFPGKSIKEFFVALKGLQSEQNSNN